MRTADAFCRRSLEEVRVIGALRETAGALVHWIVAVARPQIGEAHQAGCVGIVHHERISVAVDLICPYLAEGRMLNHPVCATAGCSLVRISLLAAARLMSEKRLTAIFRTSEWRRDSRERTADKYRHHRTDETWRRSCLPAARDCHSH